jgi:hypothetical protein
VFGSALAHCNCKSGYRRCSNTLQEHLDEAETSSQSREGTTAAQMRFASGAKDMSNPAAAEELGMRQPVGDSGQELR